MILGHTYNFNCFSWQHYHDRENGPLIMALHDMLVEEMAKRLHRIIGDPMDLCEDEVVTVSVKKEVEYNGKRYKVWVTASGEYEWVYDGPDGDDSVFRTYMDITRVECDGKAIKTIYEQERKGVA